MLLGEWLKEDLLWLLTLVPATVYKILSWTKKDEGQNT